VGDRTAKVVVALPLYRVHWLNATSSFGDDSFNFVVCSISINVYRARLLERRGPGVGVAGRPGLEQRRVEDRVMKRHRRRKIQVSCVAVWGNAEDFEGSHVGRGELGREREVEVFCREPHPIISLDDERGAVLVNFHCHSDLVVDEVVTCCLNASMDTVQER
jgi:hypothetical protein